MHKAISAVLTLQVWILLDIIFIIHVFCISLSSLFQFDELLFCLHIHSFPVFVFSAFLQVFLFFFIVLLLFPHSSLFSLSGCLAENFVYRKLFNLPLCFRSMKEMKFSPVLWCHAGNLRTTILSSSPTPPAANYTPSFIDAWINALDLPTIYVPPSINFHMLMNIPRNRMKLMQMFLGVSVRRNISCCCFT
jgi:hypothetical protein